MVFQRAPVQSRLSEDESLLRDVPNTALSVGQDVEVHLDKLLEQPWAPPATVENDRYAPIRSDDLACLFQDGLQHSCHGGVSLSCNDEERISLLIVHPVVRSGRYGEALSGKECLGDAVLAMVRADMTVNV